MNNNTTANIVSAIATVIACIAIFIALGSSHTAPKSFGGVTNYDTLKVTGLQVGANGSLIGSVAAGFCNLAPSGTTLAASTTVAIDCQGSAVGSPEVALPGVLTGDVAEVSFSTTTPTTFQGLQIRGASASSTPGFLTVLVYNGTGNTFTWTAAATSSLIYQDASPGKITGI